MSPAQPQRMPRRQPMRIVVAGGGTAGWMAAAVLARMLPAQRVQVTLVESDEIGIVGVGEATIPQLQLLNAALGIDEFAFLAATSGSYKLGIEFVGWGAAESRYIHAFGPIGRGVGQVPFHHLWLRARQWGETLPIEAWSLNAAAAYAHRFARATGQARSMVGELAHAFHFDAGRYALFLREIAESRGARRVEGEITRAERDGASGDVTALGLRDGRRVEGDLFIDCTGFRSLLLGQTLGTAWTDWSHWLPCDRALAVPCQSTGPLTPYTRSTARAAGWQWRIPLQHRTGNGHVYCSALVSDDAAADTLLAGLDGKALADPRLIKFTTGRRREAWSHNVVALGLAAGFLEPLESTSIHLTQSGIERLIRYLPQGAIEPADVAAYNAETAFEWERVRDFIILHYHLNTRPEPFWRQCAAMPVPDALAEKLAAFAANGRITRFNEELFAEVGWLQVMLGQGLTPRGHAVLADLPPEHEVREMMALMRQAIARQLAAMPDHGAFLARHCPSAVVMASGVAVVDGW